MRVFFLFLIVIFFISLSKLYCQKGYLEPGKEYSAAKIYLKNNKIRKVRDMILTNDSILSFVSYSSQVPGTQNISEIKQIKIKKGTKAVRYGLLGVGIGALCAALVLPSDPYGTIDNSAAIAIGIIGGGALIGTLIGLASPKWKYIKIKRDPTSSLEMNIYPYTHAQSKNYGLKIILTF